MPGSASFRILGGLEVRAGGEPLRLGGTVRERTLVMLLLEANQVVPVSRLVEAAWDGEPPASASHQIRKAVAGLRRRIPGGLELIVTDGPGYRAVVAEEQLDLSQYRVRLGRARKAIRRGAPDQATSELQAALALWRGPVMAGAGGSVLGAVSVALEEQRLAAAEQLFELRLRSGEAREVIGELRALAHRYPMREAVRGQLMRALRQAGRQAEALAEYWRLRELLADEVGLDPSAELSRLYESILRQSPELDSAGPPGSPMARPAPAPVRSIGVPCTLPYDLCDFAGRAAELRRIGDVATQPGETHARIVAIDGMAGSGKTSLAVRAAHRLVERYPDGQLFVDLFGFTPGRVRLSAFAAAEQLLAAAGYAGDEIPSSRAGRAALWQSVARRHRLLVVLDNAADAEQVRPLIPSSPSCLTLVTSRRRLVELDGAQCLPVGALSEQDGAELLRLTVGAGRLQCEPAAVAELVRLCGRLPLAIRIAASRLRNHPSWTVQHLVARLRDETRRLAELTVSNRSVTDALRLSYESMTPPQQTCFRLLGLHSGRMIDLPEAARLVGTDQFEAERLLDALLDVHLLEELRPGRYGFHELVRSFAHSLIDTDLFPPMPVRGNGMGPHREGRDGLSITRDIAA